MELGRRNVYYSKYVFLSLFNVCKDSFFYFCNQVLKTYVSSNQISSYFELINDIDVCLSVSLDFTLARQLYIRWLFIVRTVWPYQRTNLHLTSFHKFHMSHNPKTHSWIKLDRCVVLMNELASSFSYTQGVYHSWRRLSVLFMSLYVKSLLFTKKCDFINEIEHDCVGLRFDYHDLKNDEMSFFIRLPRLKSNHYNITCMKCFSCFGFFFTINTIAKTGYTIW